MNLEDLLPLVTGLRQQLHACAEVSGCETRTLALLKEFLLAHTSLTLHECGGGFYAAHREASSLPSLVLRADIDALATPDGPPAHLCGHDGHAAALCGVALALEGMTVGRDVLLLFQPAEETGGGAAACCEALLAQETPGVIYGAHNLPGFPFGQVVTRPGTFACASRGVTLTFTGQPTHAAYPENGISPALPVGRLLCGLPELAAPERYRGMTMCTVIGVRMGEKAFGAAAEAAEVWLTLRGEHDDDLSALHAAVLARAGALAAEGRVAFDACEQDVFPDTDNSPVHAARVLAACHGSPLHVPMRWSEDFGHYLKQIPGAYFGIGAGEDWPDLHTASYEYPDALLQHTIDAFLRLIRAEAAHDPSEG